MANDLSPRYHKIEPAMTLDLKDKVTSPLTLGQQIQDGIENGTNSPYAKNVISLEAFLANP